MDLGRVITAMVTPMNEDFSVNYDRAQEMASCLLENGSESVVEIAASCGYENVSYFNRLFKRKYGITPSRYRRRIL